jgi:polar amino acid transport system substrate-binding protein
MKKLRNLIAAAAASVLIAVPTLAKADKLQDILSAGSLRVGLLLDAAPWGYKDAKGEAAGLDVDLAKLLASDMGVKLEIVPLTGASRIPSILADKVDVLVAAMGATPERAQQVMFSQPYAAVNLGVFGPKSLPVTKNPADLKGRSIAVAKGSTARRLANGQCQGCEDRALRRYTCGHSGVSVRAGGDICREQCDRLEGC